MGGKTIAMIVISVFALASVFGLDLPSICKTAPVIYESSILNTTRWGFFPDTKKCSKFNAPFYAMGGNNFITREDCLKTCVMDSEIKYVPVDGEFRCKCYKPVYADGSKVTSTKAPTTVAVTTEAVTTSKPWWNPFGR